MKGFTAHLKPGSPPILVKEGFSWGAFLFGPVWLALQHAWIPALLHAAVIILVAALVPPPARIVVLAAIAILAGLMGRDLVRWSLDRRGYVLTHVLAARDEDTAFGRLLTYRPDIAAGIAGLLR